MIDHPSAAPTPWWVRAGRAGRRPLGAAVSGPLLALGVAAAAQGQCQPAWSGPGGGGADSEVLSFAIFDEGSPGPPPLFVGGGFFNFAGREIRSLARWDGWEASVVGKGLVGEAVGVADLEAVPSALGMIPAGLYATGTFFEAGGQAVNNLARWDGQQWHDVGGGLTSPNAVFGFAACLYDEDGDGPSPPYLYVGGLFQSAGGVPANGLARWDGNAWSQVGGGLETHIPGTNPSVYALAVYDDGRGPTLYAGGSFRYAGGKPALNIARWDGKNWEPLGPGLDSTVHTLAVYDEDADGPKRPSLFAGGAFSGDGSGKTIYHIARWDGQAWTDVGGWLSDGSVFASAVWKSPDDKTENLYIGGTFNGLPDLTEIKGIARWDGQTWRQVDYGVSGFGEGTQVDALAAFDEDGDGPNPGGLYVGGLFYYAGNVATRFVARWGCPLGPRCEADLDRSGTLDLFDFLEFINLYNTQAPAADCDGNGVFDLFDFLCFVNAFNAGC